MLHPVSTFFKDAADLLSFGKYPSTRLMLAGLFIASLIGLFASHLGGFWDAAGPFGVAAVMLLCWFTVGIAMAEYQRAAYFEARKRYLCFITPEESETGSTTAKRGLIASARAYVEHMTTEQGAKTDFRSALESTRIFYALRSHLSREFLDKLACSGRAMLVAPVGSRLPGVAHAFLDELDRLEKEWELR